MGDGDEEKNIAQGDQNTKGGEWRQEIPCPTPEECEKRDPTKYKQWGPHEFQRKSKEKLKIAVGVQLVEACILTKSVREFYPHFLMEKNPNLIECIQTQFMIDYHGCKVPEELPKKKSGAARRNKKPSNLVARIGTSENKNIIGWMYTEWKYNNVEEEEITEISEAADFGWMGDGEETEFEINVLEAKKEGARETYNLKVAVDGKEMCALNSDSELGSGGEVDYDYSFDRETRKINFTKPPPDKSRITASGFFLRKGPGKVYQGRSLSVSKANSISEKERQLDKPDEGIHYLSGRHVAKNTVVVKIDGKLQKPYDGYELKGFKEKGRRKLYIEFNKAMREKIGKKKIEVTYSEFEAHNTVEGYREVEKKDFEHAKKEALNHLSYFSETIRNANTAKYEEDFGEKMDLEEIREWIKSWKPPSRIKLAEKIYDRVFYFKCQTPGCGMHDLDRWQCVKQNLAETVHIAPNCTSRDKNVNSCGKPCAVSKVIYVCEKRFSSDRENPTAPEWKECWKPRPSLIKRDGKTVCPNCNGPTRELTNLTYLDREDVSVSLLLDDYFEAQQDSGTIVTEALPVYYLYARPERGGQVVATEDQVLNATKTSNLKDVARRVQQQLRDIHTNAETSNEPVYIHLWGYASPEFGCALNEALSKRRGEWVWRKLLTILTRDFEFFREAANDKPPINLYIQTHVFDKYGTPIPKKVLCAKIMEPHGCGRGVADIYGGTPPEDYRVIIIELSNDREGKLA